MTLENSVTWSVTRAVSCSAFWPVLVPCVLLFCAGLLPPLFRFQRSSLGSCSMHLSFWSCQRLTTGKIEKVYSHHVLAIKFVRKKQMGYSSNYTFKNHHFCEYVKFGAIWYFVNNCLIKVRILKPFLYVCDTFIHIYLPHTRFAFYLIDFQLNPDFPSRFCVCFTVKSPRVTQRLVSQENILKKSNTCCFFVQSYRLK